MAQASPGRGGEHRDLGADQNRAPAHRHGGRDRRGHRRRRGDRPGAGRATCRRAHGPPVPGAHGGPRGRGPGGAG